VRYVATPIEVTNGITADLLVDCGFGLQYRATFKLAHVMEPASARERLLARIGLEAYITGRTLVIAAQPRQLGPCLIEAWLFEAGHMRDESINIALIRMGLVQAADIMIA